MAGRTTPRGRRTSLASLRSASLHLSRVREAPQHHREWPPRPADVDHHRVTPFARSRQPPPRIAPQAVVSREPSPRVIDRGPTVVAHHRTFREESAASKTCQTCQASVPHVEQQPSSSQSCGRRGPQLAHIPTPSPGAEPWFRGAKAGRCGWASPRLCCPEREEEEADAGDERGD